MYYTAIRKNEKMAFAAIGMDVEIIILKRSKLERQISHDINYMWNLKYDTIIYKTDSQKKKTYLWLPKRNREGGDKSGL